MVANLSIALHFVMSFIGAAPDPRSFRCLACCRTLSCSHMGKADITRHIETAGHKAAACALESQQKLNEVSQKVKK